MSGRLVKELNDCTVLKCNGNRRSISLILVSPHTVIDMSHRQILRFIHYSKFIVSMMEQTNTLYLIELVGLLLTSIFSIRSLTFYFSISILKNCTNRIFSHCLCG